MCAHTLRPDWLQVGFDNLAAPYHSKIAKSAELGVNMHWILRFAGKPCLPTIILEPFFFLNTAVSSQTTLHATVLRPAKRRKLPPKTKRAAPARTGVGAGGSSLEVGSPRTSEVGQPEEVARGSAALASLLVIRLAARTRHLTSTSTVTER